MCLLNSRDSSPAATVLPVLGFALLAAAFVVQGENESLISASKSRNRATLAAVDAEIRDDRHAPGSEQHALVSGDFEAFHRYARTVMSNVFMENIVLTERSGRQQVAHARSPWWAELLHTLSQAVHTLIAG